MNQYLYNLPSFKNNGETARRMRNWLGLGVLALALAGVYSVIVVLARTPKLASLFPVKDIFHVSLVVHVDLSVLVWFLAFAGMIWTLIPCYHRGEHWLKVPYLESGARYSFFFGTLFMAVSPFVGRGEPLMNNYVPVLTNNAFFMGLGLVLTGMVLACLSVLFLTPVHKIFRVVPNDEATNDGALLFGLYGSALIALLSFVAFVASASLLDVSVGGEQYYEIVFWAGGHVLQFTHTQLLMVAWLWLLAGIGLQISLRPSWLYAMLAIGLLSALLMPFGYVLYEVYSQEHMDFFTKLMVWGGGFAPAIIGLFVIKALLWRKHIDDGELLRDNKSLLSCLLMSFVVFGVGGVFGVMIDGVNVRIPAHYHGSIVGVTLAFMGVVYMLLPRIGLAEVSYMRLAFWQPIIYGVGQLMHISGLAYSGGYGVLRKTPGGLENAVWQVKAAMGFMGLGGLLAIIGGLLFVIVIWRGWCLRPKIEESS